MKKSLQYVVIGVGIVVAGIGLYWQQHKNGIVANTIQSSVSQKTDSLYSIKYDSSAIDALNGNASFFNVVIQPDQSKLSKADSSNNTLFNIHIAEIAIKGADVAGILTGSNLQSSSIGIINPEVHVLITDKNHSNDISTDSVALYQRILGNFKSIRAGEVYIQGGYVSLFNKKTDANTSIKNIQFSISDFKIDSTKNYTNLLSYFIKGMIAKADEVTFTTAGVTMSFHEVLYDASNALVSIKNFIQKNQKGNIVSDLHNIRVSGLETSRFVQKQELHANELSTDGGLFTVYKKVSGNNQTEIELDSSFFDKAVLKKISVGNTKVLIYDKSKLTDEPLIINDVEFTASDIPVITSGYTLRHIIANSNWTLAGRDLSYITANKVYTVIIDGFSVNKAKSLITFEKIMVKPRMNESEFVKTLKVQQDLSDISLTNVIISGVDIKSLVANRVLIADDISVHPVIKIFNDRTVPRNQASKVDTDPANFFHGIDRQFSIGELHINNGYLSYRERGAISRQIGQLYFQNLDAVIKNITNISGEIKRNNVMELNATSKFQGVAEFTTHWLISLNSTNGAFSMAGKLGALNGTVLNTALEPQSMLSVKKGIVDGFTFKTTGNETAVHTTATILYHNLKLDLLEKDSTGNNLDKKDVTSFLANIIIRNENPHNGKVRINEVDYARDITRSFFYGVTQSFFLSIRKSITGKNNVK